MATPVPLEFVPFAVHGVQFEGMPLRAFWSTTALLASFGRSACSPQPGLILMSKLESLVYSRRCLTTLTNHLNCWILFVKAFTLLCSRVIHKSSLMSVDLFLKQFCKTFQQKEYNMPFGAIGL